MNLLISLSEIDFSTFWGKKVNAVIRVGAELINVKFENGNLNVECSWRLRNQNGILVGVGERRGTDFLAILHKNLLDTSITNIYHFVQTDDLIIEFENKIYLDLFADSTAFEQYQLYQGDRLFLIGK
jgi:hypothetical protein